MSDHDRATSEAVIAALFECFLMAATLDTGPNPTARAARALRHFRCYVERGKGIEPGYGGKNIHVLTDPHVPSEVHREIVRLKREGLDDRVIAEKVYRMLLSDLRIENERIQPSPQRQRNARGGW